MPEGVVNDRWSESPAKRGPLVDAMTRVGGALIEFLWPLVPASVKKVGFPPPKHSDFATPEYQTFDEVRPDKWEQTRGIGHSFSLNRNERAEDMIDVEELIHSFVDVVSKNGNLLLGVGAVPYELSHGHLTVMLPMTLPPSAAYTLRILGEDA